MVILLDPMESNIFILLLKELLKYNLLAFNMKNMKEKPLDNCKS